MGDVRVPFTRYGASINGPPEGESMDERHVPANTLRRKLSDLWANRHSRFELLMLYWLFAVLVMSVITRQTWYAAVADGRPVQYLTCSDRRWDVVDICTQNGFISIAEPLDPGLSCLQPTRRRCGANGNGCLPFTGNWSVIHCAAGCQNNDDAALFGSDIYRADSIICKAAFHAGVIGATGGCAMMRMTGEQDNFNGTCRGGNVCSQPFNSSFPSSFIFAQAPATSSNCHALNSTFILSTVVLILGSVVMFRPSKLFLLTSLMFSGYWIVVVALQPDNPDNRISALSRDLPLLAAAAGLIYYAGAEHAIYASMTTSLPNIFFYIIPFMAGLSIKTIASWLTDDSPIPRQNDASLIVVFVTPSAFLLVYHIWLICKTTCLKRMAFTLGYTTVALFYLISALILRDNFKFRFHHNTLALLLIPLTRWRNRPVVSITQALLVGTFVNGLAVEGWDSTFTRTISSINRPNAPTCVGATSDTVTLGWEADSNPPNLNRIGVILYSNFVEIQRLFHPMKPGANVSFEVANLSAHTTYDFIVSSIYEQDLLGPPSTVTSCRTTT